MPPPPGSNAAPRSPVDAVDLPKADIVAASNVLVHGVNVATTLPVDNALAAGLVPSIEALAGGGNVNMGGSGAAWARPAAVGRAVPLQHGSFVQLPSFFCSAAAGYTYSASVGADGGDYCCEKDQTQ